jgi:hypothetical protein
MPTPRLIRLNDALARHLGLNPEWLAILLGEVVDRDGIRRDIQLKGSGRTPFSRGGDGRATLGPVLREYVVSEAMAAMGIPTTRALAAVTTGETVRREKELPGAVLTRVAASHIRIGTCQFFAARGDLDALRLLLNHVISRHYPEVAKAERPALALLQEVIARQARLVAQWLLIGFIHGVMNTDNMSIAGETIDYGPCAFMDAYDPATVFSAIDEQGRYDREAAAVTGRCAIEPKAIAAIEAGEIHRSGEARTFAKHHIARSRICPVWIGLKGSNDHIGKAVAIDIAGASERARFRQTSPRHRLESHCCR